MAQESQPGGTIGVLSRPVVTGESCEPRLCQFGCGTPRPSVVRFADSPSWDYAASFRRPHGRVLHSVLSGQASVGDSVRIASGTFACSWLCEGLAVSMASVQLRNEADELDAPRAPASRRGSGPTRAVWSDRCRERFTISNCCLRRRDSATRERTQPGPSNRANVAIKWMNRTTRLRIAES
jgi:hypothetical protein